MPNFKPKNSKNLIIDEKKNETVASKHKAFLNIFYNNETIEIPKLEKNIQDLELELNNTNISIDKKLEIEDSIKNLKKEKQLLKKQKKEYYLKNIHHIFNYFEDKKNICNKVGIEKTKSFLKNTKKCINQYFYEILKFFLVA